LGPLSRAGAIRLDALPGDPGYSPLARLALAAGAAAGPVPGGSAAGPAPGDSAAGDEAQSDSAAGEPVGCPVVVTWSVAARPRRDRLGLRPQMEEVETPLSTGARHQLAHEHLDHRRRAIRERGRLDVGRDGVEIVAGEEHLAECPGIGHDRQ